MSVSVGDIEEAAENVIIHPYKVVSSPLSTSASGRLLLRSDHVSKLCEMPTEAWSLICRTWTPVLLPPQDVSAEVMVVLCLSMNGYDFNPDNIDWPGCDDMSIASIWGFVDKAITRSKGQKMCENLISVASGRTRGGYSRARNLRRVVSPLYPRLPSAMLTDMQDLRESICELEGGPESAARIMPWEEDELNNEIAEAAVEGCFPRTYSTMYEVFRNLRTQSTKHYVLQRGKDI